MAFNEPPTARPTPPDRSMADELDPLEERRPLEPLEVVDNVQDASFGSPSMARDNAAEGVFDLGINNDAYNAGKGFPTNEIKTSKYNVITFIPLNLVEQFRKVSNIFFLLVAIIGAIPGASPFSPLSNIMPLVFVLVVAMLKSGYEDYNRHRADAAANAVPAVVLREGKWVTVKSLDVRVGDLMHVRNTEELRADCVLLWSSDEDGLAYIETANLDGETSLKTRRALPVTQNIFGLKSLEKEEEPEGEENEKEEQEKEEENKVRPETVFYATEPCANLASWKGLLVQGELQVGVGIPQFLPRGTSLRNVEDAVCAAVYVGIDTKMFLNLKRKPSKMSHLDYMNNRLIGGIFAVNQFIVVTLSAASAWWTVENQDAGEGRGKWYLMPLFMLTESRGGGVYVFFFNFLGFFVLLSFMIPISLFVSLEFVKAIQALYMKWDHGMAKYDEQSGAWRFCRPKTSDLNEQLSQVRFIFTDKTGTLTENRMKLQQVVSERTMHNESTDPMALNDAIRKRPCHDDVFCDRLQGMLFAMSVCHSIVAFKKEAAENGIHYDGASPDEVALVRFASRNGAALQSRNTTSLTVLFRGSPIVVEILAELEFSPERKRMSLLVELPDKRRVLLSKGADSAMVPRRAGDPQTNAMKSDLDQELEAMSLQGLRTLVFGYRILDEETADAWMEMFCAASVSMQDRTSALEGTYDDVERDFHLLGATGVEDKLQEGVPDAIRFFAEAGIVTWMLTGDKRETAVTIAATSGLIDLQKHEVCHLDVTREFDPSAPTDDMWAHIKPELHRLHSTVQRQPGTHIMVVDGVTLGVILINDPDLFTAVGLLCAGAVACRLTPLQKAECVRLYQTETSFTVLSIGDGANDVSMIQEAKVGIGIMGLEGSQAELASDYAIPQFRHLQRLLAVHGRYSWYRSSTMVQYSFYKNTTLAMCLFLYTFFSGYSGQTMYNSWLLLLFNSFFTVWIPFTIGMFDRDIEPEAAATDPKQYPPLQRDQLHYNRWRLLEWALDTVLHGGLTFAFSYYLFWKDDFNWKSGSLTHHGGISFCVMLTFIAATGVVTIQRWDALQLFSAGISVVSIPVFILILGAMPRIEASTEWAGVSFEVLESGTTYLAVMLVTFGLFNVLTAIRKHISITEFPSTAERLIRRWRHRQRVQRFLS